MVAAGRNRSRSAPRFVCGRGAGSSLRATGVGEKIANCVLLFAYERLDAVPIDVWIGRVLSEVYFAGRSKVPLRN